LRWLIFLFPFLIFGTDLDDRLASMSLNEKIGQLFVAPVCPTRGEDHFKDWQELMAKYHVGNVILKHSDPSSQIQFLNRLQLSSKIPLLVMADAEWGLSMRMSDVIAFPKNMTLGAIDDLNLIYRLGLEIGRQAKLVGVHMNLAPVADVNRNPENPVIHMRSFGEDPIKVARCVNAYARGLQDAGVMACAKHFPGHGDTSVDSHLDLPVLNHTLERLKTVEWTPFKSGVDGGISALMTAHLDIPTIDPLLPSSLSPRCTAFMRQYLGFDGLIVTDALNMKALSDRYSLEEIALLAQEAGAELLLYGAHIDERVDELIHSTIPKAIEALKNGYATGRLDIRELDKTVLKILRAKENIEPIVSLDGVNSLQTDDAVELKKELFSRAVTLIGKSVFPIGENVGYLSFGSGDVLASAFSEVGAHEKIVIAVHQKQALTEEVIAKINSLSDRAILCLFTTPYALTHFKNFQTILIAYENDVEAQAAVFRVLKGEKQAKGHLPVTVDGVP